VLLELVNEVRRSQSATARFDQAVADAVGLNRTDMRCLDTLEREGAVSAGRLADATGLTSGAITTALDRLERSGFARRIADPSDRRRVLVEMLPAARERLHRFYAPHAELSESLFRRYTREQMELLRDFARAAADFNERHAAEIERQNRERQPAATAAGRRRR
jgi:DNA-binding MarR family transcriptional regulator